MNQPTLPRSYDIPPSEFIDLKRYPLWERESSAYRELIRRSRAELGATGAFILPGFIKERYVKEWIEEAEALDGLAFHNTLTGNAYLDDGDAALGAAHPRNLRETTALAAVAYDQFPAGSGIRMLYEWDGLMRFLEDAAGRTLYRYADELGALNLAVMRDGDYLRWHFDQTDFVSSLAIRSASAGGDFEYVPLIRSPKDENYPGVAALLGGERQGVVTLPTHPGTLILFEGRYSIHRVTRISGPQARYMALFGFDTKPGTRSSPYLRRIRYGRSE
jgi:hypothetical protein